MDMGFSIFEQTEESQEFLQEVSNGLKKSQEISGGLRSSQKNS